MVDKNKFDKKKITIAIIILVIAAILILPYYAQRKYTGKQVELPSGLSAVETVESFLDYYGKGDANAVISHHYKGKDDNITFAAPSLWLVKDVTIEKIKDITSETDFTNTGTGAIDAYDKASVKLTYTIEYYFKNSETINDYEYDLIKKMPDSNWIISDQGGDSPWEVNN